MHPLFARLDRQLALATKEFSNVEAAEARDLKLKKMGSGLYNKWAHNASIAEGIRAIYGGLESILLTIAKATDAFDPSGESWHADLIGTMADPLEDIRPAVISAKTRDLLDSIRGFRHVVNHKYALELKRPLVQRNLKTLRQLVPLFERDYRVFVKFMTKEETSGSRGTAPPPAGRSRKR